MKYDFDGDAGDFIHLGTTLAKTGKYGHLKFPESSLKEELKTGYIQFEHYEFAGHSTWRPPVWPLLIASIFLISGYSLSFLIFFKFFLFGLGAFFFYKSLRLLQLKSSLIFIGVILYLLNPAWQLYSRVFLSEPITLFFLTIFVWAVVKFYRNGTSLLIQGVFAGVLILCHPYYIFLPFSIWLFLLIYRKISLVQIFQTAICTILILGFWIGRNMIVLHTNSPIITTSSGAVMAKGWNDKVPSLHTNTKGDLADEGLVLENFEADRVYKGEVGSMQRYQDAVKVFILKNTEAILPIILKKLKSAFNPFPETKKPGILETGRVVYQFLALFATFYVLIFCGGLARSIAFGLILSTILITIITYSGFRFRMPQTALEILIITLALDHIPNRFLIKSE